jgi:hypothetical protein
LHAPRAEPAPAAAEPQAEPLLLFLLLTQPRALTHPWPSIHGHLSLAHGLTPPRCSCTGALIPINVSGAHYPCVHEHAALCRVPPLLSPSPHTRVHTQTHAHSAHAFAHRPSHHILSDFERAPAPFIYPYSPVCSCSSVTLNIALHLSPLMEAYQSAHESIDFRTTTSERMPVSQAASQT